MKNKPYIFYLRTSTDDQDLGIEAQRASLQGKYGSPVAEYVDKVSGTKINRPGLDKMLNELKPGQVVAVAKQDRLSRDMMLFGYLKVEIAKRGCEVECVECEGNSATDILLQNILQAFASFEVQKIRERTSAALQVLKSQGKRTGGTVPYGYTVDENGYLREDLEEMAIVNRILSMLENGATYNGISVILNRENVKSKTGGKWYAQSVKNVSLFAQSKRAA